MTIYDCLNIKLDTFIEPRDDLVLDPSDDLVPMCNFEPYPFWLKF